MRPTIVLLAILGLIAAGCGDDGDDGDEGADQADEIEHELEEGAEQGGARVAAETVRASLTVRELGDDEHLRDVEVLEDATEDVPGTPEVVGLTDSDGDGRDDDGRIELQVGDESACVSVSENGESVDVEGGACG